MIKKKEAEIETEAEKEKVDIKDILNQGLILDQVRIHIPDIRDQDQGHIIGMLANPRIIRNSTGEKKEKMLL